MSGSVRAAVAGVVLGAAALFLTGLGAPDLWQPDEPRYAQVAEELRSLQHGARGLWLLHLNGEPYTQKPPLYFWLAALAGAPAGRVGETAARLPSALAGIACVALLVGFGTRLRGPAVGAAAGALLATTTLFAYLARRAQLDVLLCAFELVALTAFWRLASEARSEAKPSGGGGAGSAGAVPARWAALLHGGLGLAVLVKGPVGLIVPALAILAFLAWERRLSALRRCLPPWGPLLSVAPGLLWIAGAVALAPPGFFDRAIVENLWGRFAQGTSHARPIWYYLYQFPGDFLPWTLLAPAVVIAGRRVLGASASEARASEARSEPKASGDRKGEPKASEVPQACPGDRAQVWRFLLAWLGSALLFFSLSSGKRGLYLLPVFPAAALLCADAVVGALRDGGRPPRWAISLLAALAGLALLVGLAAPSAASRFGVELPGAFPALWLALFGLVLLAFRLARGSWLARAGVVVAGVALAELLVFTAVFPAVDVEKSPRRVAEEAAALTPPGASVGVTRVTLVGALAYYGGRPVTELKEPEAIAAFLAGGGRAIVTEERHLGRVEAVTPVEIRFRARQGRRALVVVTPGAAAASAP
jgi:4-amino-4-deoxy-L-arabinose transferase-like glycosyltransferase